MSPPPLLFAFGWISLPMLGWLAVAAAPILIHLWSRRKYREMSFAAMEFLLAAMRRQTRRLLFEQWLLLAVRTLIVVLVVLAVAEPYLDRVGFAFSPGARTHRVLVFDGSYSMACKSNDKSRFDQAKELARQIVKDSPRDDIFTLVLMSAAPRIITGTTPLDSSAILEEIDAIQLPHAIANLPAAVSTIRQIVETVAAGNPRLDRHEIYFLTDLQRVTWSPNLSESAKLQFLKQTGELAQLASLFVLDLGQPIDENSAITDLRPTDSLVTVGRDINLRASLSVKPQSAVAEENAPKNRRFVELFVDGRRIARSQAKFSPEGTAAVDFAYQFDAPGDHVIEARAASDALDIDNHRYLVLPVRQTIRTLCIDGRPSGGSFRGAADYLAVALAPQGESGGRAPVQVEVAGEAALLERSLNAYDCIFLCNVAQFTASEARTLDAYLQAGGNVVFFLGDQVMADRYNRELGVAGEGRAGGPQILPAKIDTLVDRPEFRIDPLGYRHPILEPFRGRGQTSLLTTPIFKHYRLVPGKNSAATTVLALGSGDPLVIEQPVRRGRVVLVATSADPSWTAMPLWPSFVPLVQEILAWCAAEQLHQRNIAVGEPFDAVASSADTSAPNVQMPDGRSRLAQLRSTDDASVMSFADTWQSGIYLAKFGSPANRVETFAVNVDTGESDLAQVSPKELRDDVWPNIPLIVQKSWQDIDAAAIVGASRGRTPLHIGLLYTVLSLLFFETFLAWKLTPNP